MINVVLIDTNSVAHLAEVEHSQHVSVKIVEDPERDRVELQEHADSSNELSMVNETGPPPNINSPFGLRNFRGEEKKRSENQFSRMFG